MHDDKESIAGVARTDLLPMPKKGLPVETAAASAEVRAGKFSTWLRATRRARRLKVLGADVPCGTCTGCCRASFFIHVRPDETATLRHIPKRLLFPAAGLPKGHVLMGYDDEGRCPMLKGDSCSIYEHRPQTCRDFDCRVFAATGISPDDRPTRAMLAERVRAWRFDYAGAGDRKEHAAVRAAGAFLRDHADRFPAGAVPPNPTQLAVIAIHVYHVFLSLLDASESDAAMASDTEIAKAVLAEMAAHDD